MTKPVCNAKTLSDERVIHTALLWQVAWRLSYDIGYLWNKNTPIKRE